MPHLPGYIGFVPGQVEAVVVGFGVEQDVVVLAGKGAFAGAAGAVTPGDFVAEVTAAKDSVQEAFDPGVGGGVGVQVEAAAGFEEAVTFQQP